MKNDTSNEYSYLEDYYASFANKYNIYNIYTKESYGFYSDDEEIVSDNPIYVATLTQKQ